MAEAEAGIQALEEARAKANVRSCAGGEGVCLTSFREAVSATAVTNRHCAKRADLSVLEVVRNPTFFRPFYYLNLLNQVFKRLH